MNEDKIKALNSTIAMIEKQYGKGSIMKLGDYNVSATSTLSPRAVFRSTLRSA